MYERIKISDATFSAETMAIWAWYGVSVIVAGVAAGNLFPDPSSQFEGETVFAWGAFWGAMLIVAIMNIPIVAIFSVLKKSAVNTVELRAIALQDRMGEGGAIKA